MQDLKETLKTGSSLVPITAAVHPLRVHRAIKHAEPGTALSSIIHESCPSEFIDDLIVSINGVDLTREEWEVKHVMAGEVVVLRAVPGGGGGGGKILRSILMLAVIAVAFWVLGPAGAFTAGGLLAAGSTAAMVAYGVAFTVINALGNLLINALIPPPSLGNSGVASATQTFGISGIQNQELQYGVVPRIYGRTLITPPKGAHSYTTSTGSDVYLFGLFDLGPGPIAISDLKIGQTPIDDYVGVEYEIREGRVGDADITLYTNAVHQTQLSTLLTTGNTFTSRTPINTTHIEVDITFPGGLYGVTTKGDFTSNTQSFVVQVCNLSGTVLESITPSMTGANSSSLSVTHIVADMPAGQYDIKVRKTTSDPPTKEGSSKGYWSALRTWGPSTGPMLPVEHAKIAVKIKANEQLNGDIANLNCIAQAYMQVWNGTTFTEALNTHPAWATLDVLTGTSTNRALDTSRVDLDSLLDWATTYPDAEFNYVFSQRTTLWQALRTICPAGRALPVIRDGLYGVVFDAVQSNPVQLFTARNVSGFKATKAFLDDIHGMEIRYVSETMGWQQHSIYVYAAGITELTADPTKISPVTLTGVTNDDWAYKLGSYFFAASVLRPTTFQFTTDLDHLACNPGDRIWVQHDVVSAGICAGRIKSLTRNGGGAITSITLDESFTGDGASSYITMIRTADSSIYSHACTVPTSLGHVFTFASPLSDSGHVIAVGDLCALATTAVGLLDAIVKTITPSAGFKATVTCFDYAPEIHNGDADIPPIVVNDRFDKYIQARPVSTLTIDYLVADESTALKMPNGNRGARIHGHFFITDDGLPPERFDLQWQIDGDIGWNAQPTLDVATREFWINIPYSSVSTTYNVRIRGNVRDGTDSGAWTEASLTITDYNIKPTKPVISVVPILGGVKATITPASFDAVTQYRVYVGTSTFAAADMLASGPSSPLNVVGLKPPTPYSFWATTVNGVGVESDPSDPVSAIALPLSYDDLSPDVQAYQLYLGDQLRDLKDAVNIINQSVDTLHLGSYQDFKQIRTELSASSGSLQADYTQQINAFTTANSAVVDSVTLLTASLSGYIGLSAVANAFSSMQSSVVAGDAVNALAISANASSISGVSAQVGNVYASGLIRMSAGSTPAGASARVQISAAASSGAGANSAAIFLDAMTGGATRIVMIADQIFMTDGTTNTAPFFYSSGTLFMNNVVVQNINAANITSGALNTARLTANSITSTYLVSGVIDAQTLIVDNIIYTGHMQANSITNTAVASGGTTAIGLNVWTTVASVGVTTTGGVVLLSFTDYWTWSSAGPRGFCKLMREDGYVVNTVGVGGGSCPDFLIIAGSGLDTTASAGSHTYYLQQQYNAGNQPTSQLPYLIYTELKR